MRILFFVGAMNAGGAERVAAVLANHWVQRGYEVCLVMTFLGAGPSFYPLDARVDCVALADWLPARFKSPKSLASWFKWRGIRAVYQAYQPDVVLSFLTNVNVNVLMALGGAPCPIIVSERTHPSLSRSATLALKTARRFLYPRADKVVLQTQVAASALAPMLSRKTPLAVIPNPLDPQLMAYPPVQQPERPARPRVVALGRLAPVKRFDVLVRAFALLPEEFAHWELVIYGEGPERAQLEALIQQLGLYQRVCLPGLTEQPWQALAQAQIFALTSAYEGFPNALLEAMCLGLPCVAADCPSGPAELSEGGRVARLLSAQPEPAEVAQALCALMKSRSLRRALGHEARQSVQQRYAVSTVLKQWEQLFIQTQQKKGQTT